MNHLLAQDIVKLCDIIMTLLCTEEHPLCHPEMRSRHLKIPIGTILPSLKRTHKIKKGEPEKMEYLGTSQKEEKVTQSKLLLRAQGYSLLQ